MAPRSKKKRSKVVKLDDRIWVKGADGIKKYRIHKLKLQGGKCAVTGAKIHDGVLDHCHHKCGYGEDGRIRGVLTSETNMLEGRFLKLFKKAKIEDKYGITFEDFLINLGNYLKQDNTQEMFHCKYMDDFRKVVKRWGKIKVLLRLKEDFNLEPSPSTLMVDLVQMYVQFWVYEVEKLY